MTTLAIFSGGPLDKEEKLLEGQPKYYDEVEVLENHGDIYRYKDHKYDRLQGEFDPEQKVPYVYAGFIEKEL